MTAKGLSLERLASFLAVVDARGIARAAPGQPVRQSQLSRQIGELERALGVALFERGTQGPRGGRASSATSAAGWTTSGAPMPTRCRLRWAPVTAPSTG